MRSDLFRIMDVGNGEKLGTSTQNQLAHWFRGCPGVFLSEQEQACLDKRVASLFGHHIVQIGCTNPTADLLQKSPARHHAVLGKALRGGSPELDLCADPALLPFATDSVDAVVLPHTLDFSSQPHQVLREVERILIPEGRLLIIGFNPWSLWGGWRLLRRRSGVSPWNGRFFTTWRIHDWLTLLGFDLESCDQLMYRPPLRNRVLMQRLEFLEGMGQRWWPVIGGVYVLQAVKRTVTLTPIRPRWRMGKRVLPANAVEPTTRT